MTPGIAVAATCLGEVARPSASQCSKARIVDDPLFLGR